MRSSVVLDTKESGGPLRHGESARPGFGAVWQRARRAAIAARNPNPSAAEISGRSVRQVAKRTNKNRLTVRCFGGLLAACLLAATGPALAAGEAAKPLTATLSFMRAGQLYELYTSGRQNEEDHCEGFIVGVAAMMQSDQFSRIKVCIPKGTNSREVMDRVMPYLREKADSADMRAGISAVAVIAPALATLYSCASGKAPQF